MILIRLDLAMQNSAIILEYVNVGTTKPFCEFIDTVLPEAHYLHTIRIY